VVRGRIDQVSPLPLAVVARGQGGAAVAASGGRVTVIRSRKRRIRRLARKGAMGLDGQAGVDGLQGRQVGRLSASVRRALPVKSAEMNCAKIKIKNKTVRRQQVVRVTGGEQ